MTAALLVTVHLHDGRYHGAGEWPPSPARLFQALVAGAAQGPALPPAAVDALRWLEAQPAPTIAAPVVRTGAGFVTFVPNNDLDTVDGHPNRVGEIRAGKSVRPRLFEATVPLLYCWTAIDETAGVSASLRGVVEGLYQLGRGVDMAWAQAELLTAEAAEQLLAVHPGTLHRPGRGSSGALACPSPGSLDSLVARHGAQARRFRSGAAKRSVVVSQPPKARFRMVAYDCPPARTVFDLGPRPASWPLRQTVVLVERLRNGAAARLVEASPERAALIERVLIGRGAGSAEVALRPRLVPLPSIGSEFANHAIRRVLLEVPPDCPIPAADLRWALNGFEYSPASLPGPH